jgi:alkylation response protein AidB-like acyl-CoA dehydrogenase
MDLFLSNELREFRSGLEDFFSSVYPPRVEDRKHPAGLEELGLPGIKPPDRLESYWQKIAEAGYLSMLIPRQDGGEVMGMRAAQVIVEEAARVLSGLPVFETVALGVTPIVLLGASECHRKILPQIARGELRLSGCFGSLAGGDGVSLTCGQTAAEAPLNSSWTNVLSQVTEDAQNTQCSHLLSGVSPFVPSVDKVHAVLVPARSAQGEATAPGEPPGLYLVYLKGQPRNALVIEKLSAFDLARNYFRIELKEARAIRLSRNLLVAQDWQLLQCGIALLSVAELVGSAQKAIDLTLEHVKKRKQFGRTIGSFQAVQHKLVDMYLQQQETMSLAHFAAWCADLDQTQFETAAVAARAYASEVVPQICETAIQLQGGVGFSYESELHLYLRRAYMHALVGGGSRAACAELGRILLGTGAL